MKILLTLSGKPSGGKGNNALPLIA